MKRIAKDVCNLVSAGDSLAATCAGDSDIRVHDLNAGEASCQVYRSAHISINVLAELARACKLQSKTSVAQLHATRWSHLGHLCWAREDGVSSAVCCRTGTTLTE